MKNTKQRGIFRVFFYPNQDGWIGVCPEFGLIEQGKELFELKKMLMNLCQEYLTVVHEKKLDDTVLNGSVSWKHHWKFLWFRMCNNPGRRPIQNEQMFEQKGRNLQFA